MQKHCMLYAFFKAVRGNWRNAIYVSCDQISCPYGHYPACKGFLLTANEDGFPLLVSEQDFIALTNEPVEPSECHGTICRQAFESMYTLFLQWHMESPGDCPLRVISRCIAYCCQA